MTNPKILWEYLRECGHYFLATAAKGEPQIHIMADICFYEGSLYVDAAGHQALAEELSQNPMAVIGALHPDKSHLSLSAKLVKEEGSGPKEAMKKTFAHGLNKKERGPLCLFRITQLSATIWDGFDRERKIDK